MLTPGSDHQTTLERAGNRWRAFYDGHVIADTDDALILSQPGMPAAVYFPRGDVALEYMGRTDRTTTDPRIGDAGYYTLRMESEVIENAAMTYDAPDAAFAELAGRVAFCTPKVEVYEVDDALVNPRGHRHHDSHVEDVDTVVQHTDSGAGRSQREPWEPTVEPPANDEGGLR